MRMAGVKASSPLSRRRAGEHCTTPRALVAHRMVTTRWAGAEHTLDGVGHPKSHRVGSVSWALVQWATMAMGCSEA
jgi:hypothetical protein